MLIITTGDNKPTTKQTGENSMSKQNKNSKQGAKQNSQPGTVGRPPMHLKFPGGKFTVETLAALNPDACTLTIRNHINRGLKDNSIQKLEETRKTDGVGRPSFVYAQTSRIEAWKKTAGNLKQGRKTAPVTPTAPEATPEPVTAPAETATV